jgi:hypothetical protein
MAKCDNGKCIVKQNENDQISLSGNETDGADITPPPAQTTYYFCTLPYYQCIAKSTSNYAGGYISESDCKKDCSFILDKSINPTNDMLTCSYNSECEIIDSGCCGCSRGYNENTKIAINRKSTKDFLNALKTYCSGMTCVLSTSTCKLIVQAQCVNTKCVAV